MDEAIEDKNSTIIFVLLVEGEGGHDLAFGGPSRIWMLALYLFEQFRRLYVVFGHEFIHGLIVERFCRLFCVGGFFSGGDLTGS